jgi:hypothetical protein
MGGLQPSELGSTAMVAGDATDRAFYIYDWERIVYAIVRHLPPNLSPHSAQRRLSHTALICRV